MKMLAIGAVIVSILIGFAAASMVVMPGRSYKGQLPPLRGEEVELRDRLREHVVWLAGKLGERNTRNYQALASAAEYLSEQLREMGLPVRGEPYRVDGQDVVNVVAELKGASRPEEIVVVGAHYDSVPGSPGANDNATGVAAMLELARLLKDAKPSRTVRFVAFVNEEPPYFQTEEMGSLVYARQAKERKEKIVVMLSLETIGYYSDKPNSQQYPAPFGKVYPDTGNFIAFVGNLRSGRLVRSAIASFRNNASIPSEGVVAPGAIMGIGWSDHWSFWQAGYRALMITDTALFRYPRYHAESDTPERLDYDRMARVVGGILPVVRDLAGRI